MRSIVRDLQRQGRMTPPPSQPIHLKDLVRQIHPVPNIITRADEEDNGQRNLGDDASGGGDDGLHDDGDGDDNWYTEKHQL